MWAVFSMRSTSRYVLFSFFVFVYAFLICLEKTNLLGPLPGGRYRIQLFRFTSFWRKLLANKLFF